MTSYDWLKKVPQYTKDAVFGYVHEAQALLPRHNTYYNIPSLVLYLCLDYYAQREHFDTCGDKISLNEDETIAAMEGDKTDFEYNSIYGAISMSASNGHFVYKWCIQIVDIGSGIIGIGLCDVDTAKQTGAGNRCFMDGDYCIAYWVGGIEGPDLNYALTKAPKFTANDIVSIEVDMKERTLRFGCNEEQTGIVLFKQYEMDWSKTYCLAVAMMGEGAVKLVSFDQNSCSD